MTGLVTGLVMSFVVFFSPPRARLLATPTQAIAMVATPRATETAPIAPVKTVARARILTPLQPAVAADAQQKPFLSAHRMRQLAERQRERHVAFRERSSFEARFLGYDD